MAKDSGFENIAELIDATVPTHIRKGEPLDLGPFTEAMTENQFLEHMKYLGSKNKVNNRCRCRLSMKNCA